MKLKYYLRGLGIGIFISTIILSISFSGRNKALTNVEIMNKAEELGMIKEEDIELAVSEKLGKLKQQSLDEKDSSPLENTQETTPETKEPPQEEVVLEEEVESSEETVTEEPVEEISEEVTTEEVEKTESVRLTISSGMWSEDVSNLLENNRLVDSASGFNTYLIENGYQSKIRTGEYTISKQATFEEIATAITTK